MHASETIHIVFALDKNFIQHCGVVLTSIFENNKQDHFSVHIITNAEDSTHFRPLLKYIKNRNHTSSIHCLDSRLTESFKISHHVSQATYYRIFIADLIQDLSRVIYLDCDVIVEGQLRELWDVDLGTAIVGAAMDLTQNFFNAGVMLMNLSRWRNEKITQQCIAWINANNESIVFWDQDALNAVLKKKFLVLHEKWNFMNTQVNHSAIDEQSIKIIHYYGSHKPWSYYCEHPLKDRYFRYLAVSPWKNFKIYENTLLYKIKLRIKSLIGR
jgi:lipopolysaccharide biosynthesis glycosyltransferase